MDKFQMPQVKLLMLDTLLTGFGILEQQSKEIQEEIETICSGRINVSDFEDSEPVAGQRAQARKTRFNPDTMN